MDKKRFRKRTLKLIRAAASLASSMVMLYVRSRLRRKKEGIAYGPIVERDKKTIDFLNNQIYKDDMTCQRTLRFTRMIWLVLHAIGELKDELIRPPSLETPTKIASNPKWDPYFKDYVGAIGVTHI
ncbi:hypothetical protein ACQ4PT_049155 [Festuca glaucescens]